MPHTPEVEAEIRLAFERIDRFSERKHMIARLVGRGLTNDQIGNRIDVSPNTVHFHLKDMYRRLGLSSRAGLATLYQMYVSEHHHDTGNAAR